MPDLYEVLTHAAAHGWTLGEAEQDLSEADAFADSFEGDE